MSVLKEHEQKVKTDFYRPIPFSWVNLPAGKRLAAAKKQKAKRRAYYANGKHGSLDGAPIWRPKWFGTLGNDAEFIEATKPRTTFKAAYYEGGHRMMRNGLPCRVAAHVKDWAPWMKRQIASSGLDARYLDGANKQFVRLFPELCAAKSIGIGLRALSQESKGGTHFAPLDETP